MAILRNLAAMVIPAALLSACAGTPPHLPGHTERPAPAQNAIAAAQAQVVITARAMLGTPYRYGGSTPRGFDCSGLVHYSYGKAGIDVPRSTLHQQRQARPVSRHQLHPGDVLFFHQGGNKVSHVGIYIGAGDFIHAPSSGKRVNTASLRNPYWQQHFTGAGRFP